MPSLTFYYREGYGSLQEQVSCAMEAYSHDHPEDTISLRDVVVVSGFSSYAWRNHEMTADKMYDYATTFNAVFDSTTRVATQLTLHARALPDEDYWYVTDSGVPCASTSESVPRNRSATGKTKG